MALDPVEVTQPMLKENEKISPRINLSKKSANDVETAFEIASPDSSRFDFC